MTNRITLTIVFTLSFSVYLAEEVTASLQMLPLVLFAVLVFFKVVCSDFLPAGFWSLFEVDGIFFIFFLSIFILLPSFASGDSKAAEFALLVSICLILARLYMAVVPIKEVFEAFFWSGILSVAILIPLGFRDLMQSIQTFERFSPFSVHPNLVALLLTGYFCAMVWKIMAGSWPIKILAGLVGSICLVVIFFASSRGSIAGILVGCGFIAGMAFVRARKERRRKFLRMGLVAAALVLCFVPLLMNLEWTQNAYSLVDEVLKLSTPDRGFGSGLSGRFDVWYAIMMRMFSDGTWLIGRGMRTSDSLEWPVDNSYLVILYDIGLVPLILITARFFYIFGRFINGYFRAIKQEQALFYLACSLLMAVFLVNTFTDRMLFAVGNPFSLLAFIIFAAPTSRIAPVLATSPTHSIQSIGIEGSAPAGGASSVLSPFSQLPREAKS